MLIRFLRVSFCILTACCLVPSASACYSGLVIMPTVDQVGEGTYSLEYQMDGSIPGGRADTHLLNAEFGLGSRAEVGVDFDLSDGAQTRAMLNAKLTLVSRPEKGYEVAAGVYNVGRNMKACPYVVGAHNCCDSRLHLGIVKIENKARWMVGADHPLNERVTLMADYTNGRENAASLGMNYVISDSVSILAGVYLPNASGEDDGFSVHFCCVGPFNKTAE